MKILTLENGEIKLTEELLLIPEFKVIWDKYENKEKARKEFLFIYFFADHASQYKNYDEDERSKVLSNDFGVIPDEDTFKAISKYRDMSYTFNMRFLEDALYAANKTRDYFRSVDYSSKDEKGNLLYKVTDVTKALKDVMGIITTLETLKGKVEAEMVSMSKLKGGGSVSKREYGRKN
jgi:hypothetical protein